ncbi:FUSC family protein [Cellulomonas soli]|uniref:FUSC family protein n=1 Tax=Cellulomonas soli TaxID=931535 RepID=UPI003F82A739
MNLPTRLPLTDAARVVAEARVRQGWSRVRAAWFPILQAAVAGSIAFAIGHTVLGHPYPFFAPVSAWIALGFTSDRPLRRVAELSVGVALGVGLGDLVVHVIGTGWWQVAVVLFASAVIARFIDRGAMLTTQAGVQAIVIVGLPALGASGGPLGRWTDALVGGAVALAVAVLTPSDPRRRARAMARVGVEELAGVLRTAARGFAAGRSSDIEDALVRGRASQPAFDEWLDTATGARDLARVSPAARRHRGELTALVQAAVLTDRAMRNARVLTRRALPLVEASRPAQDHGEQDPAMQGHAVPDRAVPDRAAPDRAVPDRAVPDRAVPEAAGPEGVEHDLQAVAATVVDIATATDDLADALATGRAPDRARAGLLAAAARLDPFILAPDDWQVQSLVLLQRSLVVDLLEIAGVSPREARDVLPPL